MLVVIAIIGILAVVAVPALFSQIEKSKGADIIATIDQIKIATTAYYADNGNVPKDGSYVSTDKILELVNKGYLDSNPNKEEFSMSKENPVYYHLMISGEKSAQLRINIYDGYMTKKSKKEMYDKLGIKEEYLATSEGATKPDYCYFDINIVTHQ